MRRNHYRELFAQGRCAMTGWMSIGNAYAAEMIGHCGYDAVVVDLQHGPYDLDTAIGMLQAISATPAQPAARCSGLNFAEINKLLDAGAWSIICPMIDTPDDARALVSACRYPPLGRRSFGPSRAGLYGGADYFEHAADTVVTWGMIETPQGLENLEAICAVPGLDGIFIGPSDLSLALGVPPVPRWTEAPLSDALDRILATTKSAGKMAGVFCGNLDFALAMQARGFDMIVPPFDAALLTGGARQSLAALRAQAAPEA